MYHCEVTPACIHSGAWPAPEGAETTHAAHFPMYVDKLCRLNEFAHVVNEFVRQLLEVDTVSVPRHWIGVLIQADIGMDVQAMAIAWLLKHGLEGHLTWRITVVPHLTRFGECTHRREQFDVPRTKNCKLCDFHNEHREQVQLTVHGIVGEQVTHFRELDINQQYFSNAAAVQPSAVDTSRSMSSSMV